MNKLDFYTRVHISIFGCSLNWKTKALIYDHIAIMLALRAQYRTLLSNIFLNQYFFLNTNPVWLKQTFQKAIMYFKTCEQQLFGRNLGCYLHYFQYQMRCYRCIFKFPNTKNRENAPCVKLIWCTKYQHSTGRRAFT